LVQQGSQRIKEEASLAKLLQFMLPARYQQQMHRTQPMQLVRLTELIKQHFGVLELHFWVATNTRCGHETGPEKASRADIWFTRLKLVLRAFFVSIGTLGVQRLSGRANSWIFMYHKRIVPGQVWIPNRSSGRINISEYRGLSGRIEGD